MVGTHTSNKRSYNIIELVLFGLVFVWLLGLTLYISGVEDLVSKLYDRVDSIDDSITEIFVNLSDTSSKLDVLESKYVFLEDKYTELELDYNRLNARIATVEDMMTDNIKDKFDVVSKYDISELEESGYAVVIDQDYLEDVLDDYFGGKDYDVYYWFFDSNYVAYDYDILMKLLREINWYLYSLNYIDEYRDCDDYSAIAMGIIKRNLPGAACLFMAISYNSEDEGHLQIVCVSKSGELVFYDPTNEEFDILDEDDISEALIYG